MTTSISVTRHICETFGSSHDDMATHFSIRFAISRPSATLREKLAAISELARMPNWSKVECLPYIVLLVRQDSSRIVGAANRSVFEPLLQGMPTQRRKNIRGAVSQFGSSDVATALVNLNLAAKFMASETPHGVKDLGLFSIEHSLDVTIGLTMLSVLSAEDAVQTREFLDQQYFPEGGRNYIAGILDRALSQAFGLHQCLIAVDCLLSLGELRQANEALGALSQQDSHTSQILSEPNRLFRYCRMAQLNSNSASAIWARDELSTYEGLRSLPGKPFNTASPAQQLSALAAWQDAVLQLVLNSPDQHTGKEIVEVLGPFFQPRVFPISSKPKFKLERFIENASAELGPIYTQLLNEAGETVDKALFGDGLPSIFTVAPWYQREKWTSIPEIGLLNRMAMWSVFVCNLLLQSKDVSADQPGVCNLGAFLLSTSHWMHRYQRRLGSSDDSNKIENWFVLAVKPFIDGVVGGRHEYPHPDTFADVTVLIYNNGFQSEDWPDTASVEDLTRRAKATDSVLSSVIVLLANAVASTEYEHREGRWLDRCSQITAGAVEWFPKQNWVNYISLYSAQCLRALIVKADPCLTKQQRLMLDKVKSKDDWSDAVKFNRIILLLPTTDYRPWASGGVSVQDVDDRGLTSALSIAIQRVATAYSDPSTPLEIKRSWYEDFESILLKATSPGDFDRFVQVRIAQLMIDGAFSDAVEELLIDLHALNLLLFRKFLEFGSNQTFELLRVWLLVGKPIGERDTNLRLAIFEAISRHLSTLKYLGETDDRPIAIHTRTRLQARSRVIQQVLNCALAIPTPSGPALSRVTLTEAQKIRQTVLQRTVPKVGFDLPVEYDTSRQPMPLAKGHGFVSVTTEIIVPDMQTGVLRIVGLGPSGQFGNNLFADADPKAKRYIGLLVSTDEAVAALGPDLKASVSGLLPDMVVSGDLVSVEYNRPHEDAVQTVSVLKRVSALHGSDIREWPVRKESYSPLGASKLWVDRPGVGAPFRQEQETPNYLALFNPQSGEWPDYTVTYLVDPETGRGTHLVGQLVDLIIDEAENVANQRPIVLCVKDYERNPNGSLRNVTVETFPLRDYVLDAKSDLDISSIEMLEDIFSTYDGANSIRGLLLVCTVVVQSVALGELTQFHSIGPKLSLAPDGVVTTPPWSAIEINAPIDDRNLRWLEIFKESEHDADDASVLTLQARLIDGSSYVADLPEPLLVEGFPTQVQLNFGTKMLPHETILAVVDFNRTGDAYEGALSADELETRKIEAEGESLQRLLNWLMPSIHTPTEERIQLRFISKNGVDRLGFINAFSKENLPVQIWAESLSLKPIGADATPDFQRAAKKRTYSALPRFSTVSGATPPEVDFSSIPENAFVDNVAVGIIVEVASDQKGRDLGWCSIIWRGQLQDQPTLLRIENLDKIRSSPQQGWRLTLDRANPLLSGIERMSIMAEALWEVENQPLQNGPEKWAEREAGQWHEIQERASGRLLVGESNKHPESEAKESEHIHENYSVSLSTSSTLTVGRFRGDLVRRVALVLRRKDEFVALAGLVNRHIELTPGPAHLINVEHQIEPTQWDNLVKVRRRFQIQSTAESARPKLNTRPAKSTSVARTDKAATESETQLRDERLAALLAEPFLLGVHEDKTGRFIPKDPRVRKLLGGSVSIVSGEYSLLAPNEPSKAYARYGEARIRLLDAGTPSGSYSQASTVSLEEFRLVLGRPALGSRIPLNTIQLSYVGIDDTDTGRHVFEWGFGWSIALLQSQLRYRGTSLKPNQLVLAFGDRITELFLEREQDQVVINITASLPSQGHTLYRQSQENVKHVLHISTKSLHGNPNNPQIVKVEGHVGPHQSGTLRSFQQVKPRLGVTSAKQIQTLLSRGVGAGRNDEVITIYGSLDHEAFMNSQGRELVYDAIRIGTEDKGEIRGLKRNDRIFVRAEMVRQAGNETLLDVSPLSLIVEQLVDPQFGNPKRASDSLSIMRRKFSYDESALMRLASGDPHALKGSILLVRVESVRGNSIALDHKDVGPLRDQVVLDGLVARQDGAVLCIWIKGAEDQVVLEVRPGVLIALPKAVISLPHGIKGGLQEGDILEIRRSHPTASTAFRAQIAILGDRHYVQHGRPVVALPTNRLRTDRGDPRNDLQGALKAFTVGDFRQLFASIQRTNSDPAPEISRQLTSFMTQAHPKLAWLEPSNTRNDDNTLVLRLSDKEKILAGGLRWSDPNDKAVPLLRVEPLDGCDPDLAELLIDWFDVTCSTGTARAVATQFSQTRWHYHDRNTVTWKLTANGQIDNGVRPLPIGMHTPETGPLFFARVGNQATLRSDGTELQKLMLGFSNLRSELPKSQRKEGAGAIVAGTTESGLVIESTPGRIFDLPGSVLADDDDYPVQMEGLDWQAFGVGDQIWLKRETLRTDPNGQEKIILRWKHGVQNAFGPMGAVLPSCGANETEGSVTYGFGQIQVEIPSGRPLSLPKRAIIGGRPFLTDAVQSREASDHDERSRKSWHWLRDRTILAVADNLGRISAAGFESCIAIPANSYGDGTPIEWNKDPLFFDAFQFDLTGNCVSDSEKIAALIVAAGGSIAVTVEGTEVSPCGKVHVVRFSRRHQLPRTGGIAKAIVTGLTQSSDFVVMRIGGRHLKIAVTDFVGGAPSELLARIVEEVSQLKFAIWVHVLDSQVKTGITADDIPQEGSKQVRPVAFVNADGEEIASAAPILGLVCEDIRTKRLHWLPIEELSATPLTRSHAEAIFSHNVSPLDVCETESGSVSFVRNWSIMEELRQLRPGAHLAVNLIAKIKFTDRSVGEVSRSEWLDAGDSLWIVRSMATNLLMTFRTAGAEPGSEGHRPIAVEVVRRWKQGEMLRIETVLRGTAATRVDLPSEFLSAQSPVLEPKIPQQVQLLGDSDMRGAAEDLRALQNLECYNLSAALNLLIPLLSKDPDTRPQEVSEGIWRTLAELYSRGLRSFHVEPLARRHALKLMGMRAEDENLGVGKLIDEVFDLAGKAGTQKLTEKIDRLVIFASIYPLTANTRELIFAVAAAFGTQNDLRELSRGDGLVIRLVKATRPFLLSRKFFSPSEIKNLEEVTRACFEDLRHRVKSNGVDIPLMRGFRAEK